MFPPPLVLNDNYRPDHCDLQLDVNKKNSILVASGCHSQVLRGSPSQGSVLVLSQIMRSLLKPCVLWGLRMSGGVLS